MIRTIAYNIDNLAYLQKYCHHVELDRITVASFFARAERLFRSTARPFRSFCHGILLFVMTLKSFCTAAQSKTSDAMAMKALYVVRPFLGIIPEVTSPERKVRLN